MKLARVQPAADVQLAFHTCAELLVHVFSVPVVMVGVIMTHIERGQRVAYITSCIEVHGILPEAEVQVEVGIDAELSKYPCQIFFAKAAG